MPRLRWDAPASEIVPGLPETPFRLLVYRMTLRTSFDYVARILCEAGIKCDSHMLRSVTERLRKGHKLQPCLRCQRPTTSTKYCSCCQQDAAEGRLTPRERQRIAEDYDQAHVRYGQIKEAIHDFTEDEYTKCEST